MLQKLKWLVDNKSRWDKFDDYLNFLIEQMQRTMEQAEDAITIHRNQGSISALRKLKRLRDQINSLDKG